MQSIPLRDDQTIDGLRFAGSQERAYGQTLGKRLMGIRVVSVVHEKISFWHAQ